MAASSIESEEGLLLGKHTPVVRDYSPQILYAIPRGTARVGLDLDGVPFHGVDIWHAYELSWLTEQGTPVVRVGRFTVPANSTNLVESKSFKLYLNSLNHCRFAGCGDAQRVIVEDVSAVAGVQVELELFEVDDPRLGGAVLSGDSLDDLEILPPSGQPSVELLLNAGSETVEETLYSHLLRSLCPVTGQPDWATVWIHYRGRAIERVSLLQYLVAYREHQEFHEQCVERIFADLYRRCEPEVLSVQGFYTRRGGLDINPFRSSDPAAKPQARLNRQ